LRLFQPVVDGSEDMRKKLARSSARYVFFGVIAEEPPMTHTKT